MGEENDYINTNTPSDTVSVTVSDTGENTGYDRVNNIKPYNFTPGLGGEGERERHAAGVRASQENRRKRKTFQEMAQAILAVQCSPEMVSESLGAYAGSVFPEGKQPTMAELILARQSVEAANGNGKSAEYVRDSAGYKPTQAVSIEGMDDASRELLDRVAKRLEREAGKADKG